jgi:hypothetical protein
MEWDRSNMTCESSVNMKGALKCRKVTMTGSMANHLVRHQASIFHTSSCIAVLEEIQWFMTSQNLEGIFSNSLFASSPLLFRMPQVRNTFKTI